MTRRRMRSLRGAFGPFGCMRVTALVLIGLKNLVAFGALARMVVLRPAPSRGWRAWSRPELRARRPRFC